MGYRPRALAVFLFNVYFTVYFFFSKKGKAMPVHVKTQFYSL